MKKHIISHCGLYFNSWSKFGRPVWTEHKSDAFTGSGTQMLTICAELIRLKYYALRCFPLDTISTTGSEESRTND